MHNIIYHSPEHVLIFPKSCLKWRRNLLEKVQKLLSKTVQKGTKVFWKMLNKRQKYVEKCSGVAKTRGGGGCEARDTVQRIFFFFLEKFVPNSEKVLFWKISHLPVRIPVTAPVWMLCLSTLSKLSIVGSDGRGAVLLSTITLMNAQCSGSIGTAAVKFSPLEIKL